MSYGEVFLNNNNKKKIDVPNYFYFYSIMIMFRKEISKRATILQK